MISKILAPQPAVVLLAIAAMGLGACASSQPLSEEEQTDAIRACFEKHENYPSARMACINRARTADVETDASEQAE